MRSARLTPFSRGVARRGLVVTLALWLAATAGVAPLRADGIVAVAMDKAKLLRYPPATETVVLGNPIIADVTMLRGAGTLILTGKSFGETNLVLLDRAGNIVSQLTVRVEQPNNLVIVQRGMDRESYSCQPRCQPAVSVGDATIYLGNAIAAIKSRNDLATPQAPAAMAGPH